MTRHVGSLIQLLESVAASAEEIQTLTWDMDEAAFFADRRTQLAVSFSFVVIGEACRSIARHYPAFATLHPEIPFALANDMRNSIAHDYFRIDYQVVWRSLTEDLPVLLPAILAARDELITQVDDS